MLIELGNGNNYKRKNTYNLNKFTFTSELYIMTR